MSKDLNKKIMSLAAVFTLSAATAMALPIQHFAKSSVLANGKWVKIAIPSSGVYEITDSELQEMGFSNPEKVQLYGQGSAVINEVLNGDYPDDLRPVSTAHMNGKLCFYAQGPTAYKIVDAFNQLPRYKRTLNCYSNMGYYFLVEAPNTQTVDIVAPSTTRGTEERSTSLAHVLHEKEIISVGNSGKEFLGEDIVGKNLMIDYKLPGNADSTIIVNVAMGVKNQAYTYASGTVITNGQSAPLNFTIAQSKIPAISDTRALYNYAEPAISVKTNGISTEGQVNVFASSQSASIVPSLAKLDYVLITYNKTNAIIEGEDNQTDMGFVQPSTSDCIMLPGASASTVVWNVDNINAPIQYTLSPTMQEDSIVGYEFTPRMNGTSAHYVAFDPEGQLKKIASYEAIENQNLHALPTPDMLIITDKAFMSEAQRIADLHKAVDNLDVAVVDQQQVFNEFSSGTPDAMAYRLMCKMFYDRNRNKFRNLLLFGPGSFDNRGITTDKANRLLTYQSTVSNNKDNTFVSDDFFGILDDESGSDITLMRSDILRIGVGRYPVNNIEEARNDVDKLIKYVANPDYGPWRNDALIMADTGDDDLHISEAEGVNDLIESSLGTQLATNKVYVDMFQYSITDKTTSSEARRRFIEYLNSGQYFMTYVGHAGPLNFTRSKLWSSSLAQSTSYSHLPIFTTACCEVARYDSNERGIAEYMLHKKDGGAIALLASTRETYAMWNDIMNNAFSRSFFSYSTTGHMPTLGEVYLNTKQKFGTAINGNKMSYHLLGDPAIKINYPKPLCDITSVNGVSPDQNVIAVTPMQEVTITAQVNKENGEGIDTDFNGDATVTLYDAKRFLKHANNGDIDIYYPRDVLARVQGRVVAGQFTGKLVVPRHVKGLDENAALKIYAHKDNSDHMVNGMLNNLVIGEYDETLAVTDDNAPVIDEMFLNDQVSFSDGGVVPANSTLYISASDDVALNTQMASVGNNMKLMLDGGVTTYHTIKDHATAMNDGRDLQIAFPLTGLTVGTHTLAFTVFDVAGHSATRTISFIVSGSSDIVLTAEEAPAITKATFNIEEAKFDTTPMVNIKVTDAHGNIVWTKSTSSFPATWDLTDAQGNRVKAGLYKYFGNYDNGANYGGTNIGDLIVIDNVKSNK